MHQIRYQQLGLRAAYKVCALSFAMSTIMPLAGPQQVFAYDPIISPAQAGTEENNHVFKQIEKSEDDANHHLTWRDALKEGDRRLGSQQLDLAEGCYRQALRQIKKDRAASPEDRAMVDEKLAMLLQSLDITDEARPLYKKAIVTLTKARGKESPQLIPYLLAFAAVDENDGDYKAALKLLEQALSIARNKQQDGFVLAKCLHAYGHLQFRLEHNAIAEQNYQLSLLSLLTQNTLPDGVLLDTVIADYSDILEKNYARAKNIPSAVNAELLRDKLNLLSQKQGVAPSKFESEVSSRLAKTTMDKIPEQELTGTEPSAPSPLLSIAGPKDAFDPVSNLGIDQQKISFYERMVAVDIKSLGPEHPSVARDLSGLSALYMAAGEYDQAKTLLMRALQIYEKVYGADSALTIRTRAMLELVNENQATAASGSTSGDGFVADIPKIPLQAQKIDTAIRLSYLASQLYNLGKVPEASQIYSYAVADVYKSSGDQNLLMAASLNDFARVLRSAGNAPRATLLEADARAIKVKVVSRQLARSVK